MKRRRFLNALTAGSLLGGFVHAEDRALPAFRILDDGWGNASLSDLTAVINSAAGILWKYFPGRRLEPIMIQRTRTGPMVHFERNYRREIVMDLDTEDTYWCQYAYQFAHEFCHILANFDLDGTSNLWFEEMLCETASLFTLRHMADLWRTEPPFPQWKPYAKELSKYSETVVKSREKIPSGTLAEFYKKHVEELRGKPASRELNGAMATVLLEMFEQSPERWEAVTWLNTSKSAPGETFGFYLEKWLRAAPPRHQLFIVEIKRAFGII